MRSKEKIGIMLFLVLIISSFILAVWIEGKSQTRQNLAIIDEEFMNFTSEEVMISNISHIRAQEIAWDVRNIDGVYSVVFNKTPNYYRDTSALFIITYDVKASDDIKKEIEAFDPEKDESMIMRKFGVRNKLELIVPCGDYEAEKQLLDSLSRYREVESVKGLSNIETIGGYSLTDRLNAQEFSQLMKLDYDVVAERGPLIHMVESLYNQAKEGHIRLDNGYMAKLEEYQEDLNRMRNLMEGENYSRIFINLDLPIEGEKTTSFISRIFSELSLHYDMDSVFIVGDSITALERRGVSFEKN